MVLYRIVSSAGLDMGTYQAESWRAALDAMSRAAGYADALAAEAVAGKFDGTVTAIAVTDVPKGAGARAWAAEAGGAELSWETGVGDEKLVGWTGANGTRCIETNGDPVFSECEENFDACWNAMSIRLAGWAAPTVTLAEQATMGLDVVSARGVVRVRDGQDTWLCRAAAWDAAVAKLGEQKAYSSDDGGADAYRALCDEVAAPIASVNGRSRGDWARLVSDAVSADLVDPDDATRMYGDVTD